MTDQQRSDVMAGIDARFHTFDQGRSLLAGTLDISHLKPIAAPPESMRPRYSMGRDNARVYGIRGGEANKKNHSAHYLKRGPKPTKPACAAYRETKNGKDTFGEQRFKCADCDQRLEAHK